MKAWICIVVLALAGASQSAWADMVRSPRTPPYLPVPVGAAVILNTGSTNAAGYRIVVQLSGSVEYVAASRRDTATIDDRLAAKFFSDLKAAGPLQDLQTTPCMKSVSFGTSLFVWWEHGRSPDLSCSSGEQARAVAADASQIAAALHLAPGSFSPVMRPLMPGEQHKALPPAPTPSG
jgi:hypothetical protein